MSSGWRWTLGRVTGLRRGCVDFLRGHEHDGADAGVAGGVHGQRHGGGGLVVWELGDDVGVVLAEGKVERLYATAEPTLNSILDSFLVH